MLDQNELDSLLNNRHAFIKFLQTNGTDKKFGYQDVIQNYNDSLLNIILRKTDKYNKDKHYECIKLILDMDPNIVKSYDSEKNTPLHIAVSRNLVDIAKLLLEYKPDLTAKNSDGQPPFHLIARNSKPKKMVELFINTVNKLFPTKHDNFINRNEGKANLLNLTGKHGMTLLSALAAEHNNPYIEENRYTAVELLLKEPLCDVNNPGENKLTILHWAVAFKATHILGLIYKLRSHDIKFTKDSFGRTPLDMMQKSDESYDDILGFFKSQNVDFPLSTKVTTFLNAKNYSPSLFSKPEEPLRKQIKKKVSDFGDLNLKSAVKLIKALNLSDSSQMIWCFDKDQNQFNLVFFSESDKKIKNIEFKCDRCERYIELRGKDISENSAERVYFNTLSEFENNFIKPLIEENKQIDKGKKLKL